MKNIFDGFAQQRNKIINPNALPKWREEWRDAARELFGAKEKRSVDEALSSVKTPTHSKPTPSASDEEAAAEYTGSSALVAVKEDESAWQRVSARFREAPIIQGILDAAKLAARTEAGKKVGEKAKQAKDKLGDAREDVLEFWETSQNPYVVLVDRLGVCVTQARLLDGSVGSGLTNYRVHVLRYCASGGCTACRRSTTVSSAKRRWQWRSSACQSHSCLPLGSNKAPNDVTVVVQGDSTCRAGLYPGRVEGGTAAIPLADNRQSAWASTHTSVWLNDVRRTLRRLSCPACSRRSCAETAEI